VREAARAARAEDERERGLHGGLLEPRQALGRCFWSLAGCDENRREREGGGPSGSPAIRSDVLARARDAHGAVAVLEVHLLAAVVAL
jgi:hypothetical protein